MMPSLRSKTLNNDVKEEMKLNTKITNNEEINIEMFDTKSIGL